MARTVIVGGGISGLSAAYELIAHGQRPLLFEAKPYLGGLIQTEVVNGCVIEAGPDSFLTAKPEALELITDLGLKPNIISSNDSRRITYIVKNGKLQAMPDGLLMMVPTKLAPVLTTPLFGLSTKVRMAADYFRQPPNPPPPERSVAAFIADHYGQEVVDYLADPLLSGVYGGRAENLSATSVLPRFIEIERRYGSLSRGVLADRKKTQSKGHVPLFQTLRNGLGEMVQTLLARIAPNSDIVHEPVIAMTASPEGFQVTSGRTSVTAGHLILACPAWEAAKLLNTVHTGLAELLSTIDYSSSIALALGIRREDCGAIPPGFGFLVPRRERLSLVACTFTGAKFPHRVPEDMVVLRCFLGGQGREDVFNLSDDELVDVASRDLETLLGWRPKPAFIRLYRWPRSMAQYTIGHQVRLRQIKEILQGIPGLHLAGNAYEGIGIPDCIRTGRAAARASLGGRNDA